MVALSYPVFRYHDVNGFTAVLRLQKLTARGGIYDTGEPFNEIQADLLGKLFVIRWRGKTHEFNHENNASKVEATIKFCADVKAGYIGNIWLYPPQGADPSAFGASIEFSLHRSMFEPLVILFRRDFAFYSTQNWDEEETPEEGPHNVGFIKRVEFEVPEMPRRFLSYCSKPRPESGA